MKTGSRTEWVKSRVAEGALRNRKLVRAGVVLAVMALAARCGGAGDGESSLLDDPENDVAVGEGKEDSVHLTDCEARSVLELSNRARANADLLTAAGVNKRAANAIARYTETIDDLAELDRIPYVGRVTFAQLQAYARRTGCLSAGQETDAGAPAHPVIDAGATAPVDAGAGAAWPQLYVHFALGPMPFAPCSGDLTPVEMQQIYVAGASMRARLKRFERRCDVNQGQRTCEAWAQKPLPAPPNHGYFNGSLSRDLYAKILVDHANVPFVSIADAEGDISGNASLSAFSGGTRMDLRLYCTYRNYGSNPRHECGFGALSGPVSESCISLWNTGTGSRVSFSETVFSETETVHALVSE